MWNYELEKFKNTGLQFCGLIMGDHSKCSINTMFNTGTVFIPNIIRKLINSLLKHSNYSANYVLP